jgi:hypothetical protein
MAHSEDHDYERIERIGASVMETFLEISGEDEPERFLGVVCLPCGCFDLHTAGLEPWEVMHQMIHVMEKVAEQLGGSFEASITVGPAERPQGARGPAA